MTDGPDGCTVISMSTDERLTATPYPGVQIRRRMDGHAYAKNGHADSRGHGTPRYVWDIVHNGRVVSAPYPRRSSCTQILDDLATEFGWARS